jgi:chemotaxis protein methyltransferase CheR
VGKRLNRRLVELGLDDLSAYRALLLREPAEWAQLDVICCIPISRFYRDQGVFEAIGERFLPEAAAMAAKRGDGVVRCWSAGCASGEEPYTLALLWHYEVARDWPSMRLEVLATDVDTTMIARAKAACYARSSLKDLPRQWFESAFAPSGPLFCLLPEFRRGVTFALQNIRETMPDGPFDLILCRNLAFMYFDEELQRQTLERLKERLVPGGFLVLGTHESLPSGASGFHPIKSGLPVYRREQS